MQMAGETARQAGRALQLGDADRIRAALPGGAFHPAEYAFANLWLFRRVHDYQLLEFPVLHLRGRTYDGKVHALPLSRPDRAEAAAMFETGVDCLYPYGEDGPELAQSLGLDAHFKEADSDYWFRGADMASLSAAKTRRSQARQYEAEHSPVFEEWHAGLAPVALAVLEGWAQDITRPAEETDVAECREAITIAGELGLVGGLVRVGDDPIAFLLASESGDARIVHFAKGRRAHSHAYPWMFSTFAARSEANWINFEQDLGIPGLAQSKRAYGPNNVQPKYRLVKDLRI